MRLVSFRPRVPVRAGKCYMGRLRSGFALDREYCLSTRNAPTSRPRPRCCRSGLDAESAEVVERGARDITRGVS